MARRALSKSVSVQEMQEMRDEGMTNQEIADSLEISYHTVLRYLGKAPSGVRASYGSSRKADKMPEAKKPVLTLVSRILEYEGKHLRYVLLPEADSLMIKTKADGTEIMRITKAELEQHIAELVDIHNIISTTDGRVK